MRNKPRVLLFDPYFSTLGGGERYLFAVADCLAADFDVKIAGPSIPSRKVMVDLGFETKAHLSRMPRWRFPFHSPFYDYVFYTTNGPPVPSFCANSFLINQFPFRKLDRSFVGIMGRLTTSRYKIVTYSKYCQEWIDIRWHRDSTVVYPPAKQGNYVEKEKQKNILSIGRFYPGRHSKRQDALVEAFRSLPSSIREEWSLTLVGSTSEKSEARKFVEDIRSASQGLNIEIKISPTQDELEKLLNSSSIYWHATGYERPEDNPEDAEHFGISVVEAMSYGAVPCVYDDGGPREIVSDEVGFRWKTIHDLADATTNLIQDQKLRVGLAHAAQQASDSYNQGRFCEEIRLLL